ncbi:MAG: hypothetical protein KBG09_04395 [Syntrophobacterales bacterium]|nr:hypothetical protein [Syntrophobacterales bacterium]
MKKIITTFVTILVVMVLSGPVFAFGPSWNNGNRYDIRNGHQPAHFQFDNHHRPVFHQKVIYVPVRPTPVVHTPHHVRPVIAISIPNFSLWIR